MFDIRYLSSVDPSAYQYVMHLILYIVSVGEKTYEVREERSRDHSDLS